MITLLENALERADGAYFSPEDLQALDRTIASWQIRRQTYDLIQAKEQAIVDQVIAHVNKTIPNIMGRFADNNMDKCRRDLPLVLRSCATAMLLQDEELLKDRFLSWFQNIMSALRKQKVNDQVYKSLQQVVREQLPTENAVLFMPYLVTAHQWLS